MTLGRSKFCATTVTWCTWPPTYKWTCFVYHADPFKCNTVDFLIYCDDFEGKTTTAIQLSFHSPRVRLSQHLCNPLNGTAPNQTSNKFDNRQAFYWTPCQKSSDKKCEAFRPERTLGSQDKGKFLHSTPLWCSSTLVSIRERGYLHQPIIWLDEEKGLNHWGHFIIRGGILYDTADLANTTELSPTMRGYSLIWRASKYFQPHRNT